MPKLTHNTTTATGRLAPGALPLAVMRYMTKATEPTGPSQVAKSIGRSAGAVQNAMAKLTADGALVMTAKHPRRYALASAKKNRRVA